MAERKKSEVIKKALSKYGAKSLEKLMELADEEETPAKLKAEIYKWFAEMEFGKPVNKVQDDNPEGQEVSLEGDMAKWSE